MYMLIYVPCPKLHKVYSNLYHLIESMAKYWKIQSNGIDIDYLHEYRYDLPHWMKHRTSIILFPIIQVMRGLSEYNAYIVGTDLESCERLKELYFSRTSREKKCLYRCQCHGNISDDIFKLPYKCAFLAEKINGNSVGKETTT